VTSLPSSTARPVVLIQKRRRRILDMTAPAVLESSELDQSSEGGEPLTAERRGSERADRGWMRPCLLLGLLAQWPVVGVEDAPSEALE